VDFLAYPSILSFACKVFWTKVFVGCISIKLTLRFRKLSEYNQQNSVICYAGLLNFKQQYYHFLFFLFIIIFNDLFFYLCWQLILKSVGLLNFIQYNPCHNWHISCIELSCRIHLKKLRCVIDFLKRGDVIDDRHPKKLEARNTRGSNYRINKLMD